MIYNGQKIDTPKYVIELAREQRIKALLAIEIDGDIHKYQKEYDNYRDDFIANIGITTLRFSADEVINSIDSVLEQIAYILLKRPV